MSEVKDGTIPLPESRLADLEAEIKTLRQTLRDDFAVEAINAFLQADPRTESHYFMAQRAYEVADAMLLARS